VLAMYGALYSFSLLYANVLVATGATTRLLLVQVGWVLVLAPGIVVGFRAAGLVGAAWAHVLTIGVIALPGYLWAALRSTGQAPRVLVPALVRPAIGAAVGGVAAWMASVGLSDDLLALAVGGTAGVGAYLVLTAPLLVPYVPASVGRRLERLAWSGHDKARKM